MSARPAREPGEHEDWCSYYFAFAEDAESLCDCARRHDVGVSRYAGAPYLPASGSMLAASSAPACLAGGVETIGAFEDEPRLAAVDGRLQDAEDLRAGRALGERYARPVTEVTPGAVSAAIIARLLGVGS